MARKRKHHGLMGDVNLLGLDEFGQNPGISPITGALIGGGVAGGTRIVIGQMAGTAAFAADRNFWGLVAGLGAAGALWLSGPSRARHASWGAAVGAFLAAGLPWLEQKISPATPVKDAGAAIATGATPAPGAPATGTAGFGIPRVHALNGGLGMRRQAGGHFLNGNGLGVAKIHSLNGAGGLGLATVMNQSQSVGTIPGVHGPAFAGTQLGRNPPVSAHLLGGGKPSLLGGPPVHGLSAAYGATLLGGGR